MADPHLTHQGGRASPLDHPLHVRWGSALLLFLLLLPVVLQALGQDFYVGMASRILIFALAASSLNLVLGFGGLVSFGHAAFVGLGGYTVGVLMQHGLVSAWLAWPLGALVAGLMAALIGLVSLRTQGVYFIMITLAFAQMLYYLAVSLKVYGGDDGLMLASRNTLLPGLDLASDATFYYVVLALFLATFLAVYRWVNSPWGHALQAVRDNGERMAALGHPVMRIRLAAFSLGGALAGLSGALLANQASFVSPAGMAWSQSGMLMVMVILGGVGRLYGGVAGATLFLVAEEVLAAYTIHWQFGLGLLLLAVVLRAPNGLLSLLMPKNQ
jgi:branched-chain amino acid transport system permease protein